MGGRPDRGEGDRVEELLRVNAELAAEIRSLTLGRAAEPRSTLLNVTRRISKAEVERDEALAQIGVLRGETAELRDRNEELRQEIERQVSELERLRAGPLGLLRRAKAAFLRRRATRGAGA